MVSIGNVLWGLFYLFLLYVTVKLWNRWFPKQYTKGEIYSKHTKYNCMMFIYNYYLGVNYIWNDKPKMRMVCVDLDTYNTVEIGDKTIINV